MSREQFSDLCRTCMSLGATLSLFSPGDSFAYQIKSFIDIEMLPGDELPDKVCKTCVNKLRTLKDFVILCKTSDKILRGIFQNAEKCPKTIDTHIIKEENKDNDAKLLENIDSIELNQTNIESKKNLNKLEEQLPASVNEANEPQKEKPLFFKLPIVCDDCGREYISHSYYLKHRRTHTDEKPFKCSSCPDAFSTKKALAVHLRTHTGEKLDACTSYSKVYMEEEEEKCTHKATHTEGPTQAFTSKIIALTEEQKKMRDKFAKKSRNILLRRIHRYNLAGRSYTREIHHDHPYVRRASDIDKRINIIDEHVSKLDESAQTENDQSINKKCKT